MLRKIKNQPKILVAVFLSIGLVIGMTAWTVSQENRWYPSIWGADDQRGALNRLTTEKVLGAVSLIKTGKVYELGRVYEDAMPLFGTRHFSLRIPQMSGPLGDNQVTWHEEIFSGEIGQIGTQFDGLANDLNLLQHGGVHPPPMSISEMDRQSRYCTYDRHPLTSHLMKI